MEFDDENPQQETETEQLELTEESDEESLEEFSEGEGQAESDEPAEDDKRPTIFISYNHNANDIRVADRIYAELSKRYDVFLDRVTILPSQDYEDVTEDPAMSPQAAWSPARHPARPLNTHTAPITQAPGN
ncbi:MAG: hypothetical protein ACJ74J_05815 [Blastocatellia bacterium]